MAAWVWPVVMIIGGLFVIKMLYVVSTVLALPATRGALYVSTGKDRIRRIFDEIAPEPGQRFVDLGCGDGRVLRAAKSRYDVTAAGYEINPLAFVRARLSCLGSGIRVYRKDFWQVPLDGADVIFCYLFPDVLGRLAEKLSKEAKPGTVVISCNFRIPELTPERVLRGAGRGSGDPVYIYRMP